MKLRHRTTLDRVVRLAVAFDEATDDGAEGSVTFELPEDLNALSDAELTELRDQAVSLFREVYGDGDRNFTPEDLEVLRSLRAARDVLDAEVAKREEAAAESNAQARDLAAGMIDDAPAEDPAPVVDEVPIAAAVEAQPELLVAAAAPKKFVVPAGRRRPPAPPAAEVSPMRSATGLAGLAPGQPMTEHDLARAYAAAEKGVSRATIDAAVRGGRAYSQRTPIAQIHVPFADQAVVRSEDPDMVAQAIRFATNESRLQGGSLVAAGGWCAPSERIYDLITLESSAGMLSLPTLNPARGGIENTLGPDWRDLFASVGFCFTEADDIAGNYGMTNEVQSVTEGGSGLTSFTLTYAGQTTASIAAAATAATVQARLEALSNIGVGNVTVSGSAGGPYTVTFTGVLGDTNVAQMTSTPTGGTGTVTVATVTPGDPAGASSKPCTTVACPTWVDNRMDACGVCINAGILLNRAYPELVRRYTSGALIAHGHRVNAQVLADLVAGSDPITVTDGDASPGALAPLLSSIELRTTAIRNSWRMNPNVTLEAVFPMWVFGLVRADLSRQLGVPNDKFSVTDAMIRAWFASRGINAQFVYDWQDLALGSTTWPTSVRFLLYPAGTWVRLAGDIITLEALHDSTLNAANNYTALFTEEAWGTMKTVQTSEVVTVPVCPSGVTQGGVNLVCTPAGH